MSTCYSEAFTEDELKSELCRVFDCGMAAFNLFGHADDLRRAKNKALSEFFGQLLAWHFPKLDETTSLGPVQEYIHEKEKHDQRTRGQEGRA